MKKILTIDGMTCDHCANRVTNALEEIDGVKSVKVKLRKKIATVKLSGDVDDNILKTTVEDAGYSVTDVKQK
mgnify:CR=1 FL=1